MKPLAEPSQGSEHWVLTATGRRWCVELDSTVKRLINPIVPRVHSRRNKTLKQRLSTLSSFQDRRRVAGVNTDPVNALAVIEQGTIWQRVSCLAVTKEKSDPGTIDSRRCSGIVHLDQRIVCQKETYDRGQDRYSSPPAAPFSEQSVGCDAQTTAYRKQNRSRQERELMLEIYMQ
jgi:hypothetical protein